MADETLEPKQDTAQQAKPRPATNLLLADIVLSGVAGRMRKNVRGRMVQAKGDLPQDKGALDGRTILSTLTLYGASKLASRSVAGLATVAGGLLLKTLYDRGKARELERGDPAPSDQQE